MRSSGGTRSPLTRTEQRRQERARARVQRTRDMYQGYLRGMTLAEIAELYGISRERVRQLFYMERLPSRKLGWYPPGHPRREDYLLRRS